MAEGKYGKCLVKKPAREVGAGSGIKGRTIPTLTYMSNDLVPGSNTYIEVGWIYDIPDPNPHVLSHSHDYDEIVIRIGADPDNPEYLGAEIESYLGGEKLISDKTNALFIPANAEHGKVKWNKFEKPHILMSIMLGTGNFEEANPAGYNK